MGHNWEPIWAFAEMHYQLLLKLEIIETCILTKKQKKMLFPYGELPLEEIQSKESIKHVIHIVGIAISLINMHADRDEYRFTGSYCQNTTLGTKFRVSFV